MTYFNWLESQGMDAAFGGSNDFVGIGLKAEVLGDDAWEKLTAQDVEQQLKATRSKAYQMLNRGEDKRAIYAFQTRKGGTGILQVIAFTDKGVKIRYKLVGKVDDIDLPFIDDPQVLGEWKSVDFVAAPSEFSPDKPSWKGEMYLGERTDVPPRRQDALAMVNVDQRRADRSWRQDRQPL